MKVWNRISLWFFVVTPQLWCHVKYCEVTNFSVSIVQKMLSQKFILSMHSFAFHKIIQKQKFNDTNVKYKLYECALILCDAINISVYHKVLTNRTVKTNTF